MGLIRRGRMIRVVLFACAVAAVYATQLAIDHYWQARSSSGELLYFPSTRFTQVAACGFDNIVGDYIWLDVIQYYGQHKLSDGQYRYLSHMLQVVALLLPRHTASYKFGALLLISDGGDAAGAFALLELGMRNNPADWTIPFTRGFLNYVFTRDYRQAGRWFALAARLPGASEMAGRFAAFSLQKGEDLASSRELWMELYQRSRNKTERQMAQYYIDKIDRELLIAKLQSIIGTFLQDKGGSPASLSQLVKDRYLRYVPDDPLGGKFVLDPRTHEVKAIGGRTL